MILELIIYIAYGILAGMAALIGRQLRYAATHFTPPVITEPLKQEELPSVTVCIPARNEQHALSDCLEAVLASHYPKLEIIVLDDESADTTSALIHSFASRGVRFVSGSPLPKGWLGKNYALENLLKEASGTYVLFMAVDTHLEPQAVTQLVNYVIREKVEMVSVMPRREDGWRASVVLSPLRYFWELLFHRRLSPAAASNAWLIRRSLLRTRFQGFVAFKQAVQPETKIAAELAGTHEYRFIMSTPEVGVSYQKKWRSQLETSVRLLFPLMNMQWALVIVAALDLLLLLLPFAVVLSVLFVPFGFVHFIGGLVGVSFMALYGVYTRRMWRRGWWLGALLWPLLLLQELGLVIASAYLHATHAVTWKGRPIEAVPMTAPKEARS